MEKIRALSREGLMALPRVGMGVGGLLLGIRRGGVVQLMDSVEIPCSHAGGPSFNLSGEEKAMVAELIAGAGQPGVVGWYCSRTRGAAALNDTELAIDRQFFSAPGQITLVLRPSAAEPTRAAFYFHDDSGSLVKTVECDVDEWRPAEIEAEKEEVEPVAGIKAEIKAEIKPEIKPVVVPDKAPEIAPVAKLAAVPNGIIREPVPLPPPVKALPIKPAPSVNMFAFADKPPRTKNKKWLATGLGVALLLAGGAAAFFTEDAWLPRPPLTLSSAASEGNLVIRWNVDALRGIDKATLFLNDGGNLQSLPLGSFQLSQGVFVYSPKSERVTAKLSVGETSAIAVWFAPAPPPVEPPTPDVPAPVPHAADK